jgi:hypothetical protein
MLGSAVLESVLLIRQWIWLQCLLTPSATTTIATSPFTSATIAFLQHANFPHHCTQ